MDEKQAELNNHEAHLEVLKGNIRVANKALEEALAKRREAEEALPLVLAKLDDARRELAETSKLAQDESKRRDNLLNGHEEVEVKLRKAHEELKQGFKVEKASLESDIASLTSAKKKAEKELVSVQQNLAKESAKLSPIIKSISEYEQKDKEAKQRAVDSREAAEAEQERLDKLDTAVREKEQELRQLNQTIEQKWKEVEAPLAVLKEKERLQEVRENDFRILVNRAQRVIEKQLPGFKLNIK